MFSHDHHGECKKTCNIVYYPMKLRAMASESNISILLYFAPEQVMVAVMGNQEDTLTYWIIL